MITLYDIFGPGYLFNGRGSYQNSRWLPGSISQDSGTGSLITMAGETPLLCHRNVTRSSCLSILKDAGLPVAQEFYIYEDQKSYSRLLNALQKKNQKLIINYAHLQGEWDENQYWIKTELLTYINNKRNLEDLVPKPYVPERKILTIQEFRNNHSIPFEFPYVVKAATDEPNGGGLDVCICKNVMHLQQAKQMFKSCSHVVIEKFLPIKKNYCVQFAQTYTGRLVYLGTAEQIINEEGKYGGNWIHAKDQPPTEAIELCKGIMEKAVSLGYWGFSGIDTVMTEDHRIFVIDLNFRQNGSTGALLLRDSIMESWGVSVLKLRRWKTTLTFKECRNSVEPFIEGKMLVLICVYNPMIPTADNPIYISSLVVGHSKEEIKGIEREMENSGFE
ncbi:ATP-grasp domain-containing protein [Ammoniphilus sp. 3BR4]